MASWRGLGRGLTAASQALTGLPGIFAELGKEERAEERLQKQLSREASQKVYEVVDNAYERFEEGKTPSDLDGMIDFIIKQSDMPEEEGAELRAFSSKGIASTRDRFMSNTTDALMQDIAGQPTPEAAYRAEQAGRQRHESLGVPFKTVTGDERLASKMGTPLGPGMPLPDTAPRTLEVDGISAEFGSPAELLEAGKGQFTPLGGRLEGIYGAHADEATRIKDERQEALDEEREYQEEESNRLQDRAQRIYQQNYTFTRDKEQQIYIGEHAETGEPVYIANSVWSIYTNLVSPSEQGAFISSLLQESDPDGSSFDENGEPVGFTTEINRGLSDIALEGLSPEKQSAYLNADLGTRAQFAFLDEIKGNEQRYTRATIASFREYYDKAELALRTRAIQLAQEAGAADFGLTGGSAEVYLRKQDPQTLAIIQQDLADEVAGRLFLLKQRAVFDMGGDVEIADRIVNTVFNELGRRVQMIIEAEDNDGRYDGIRMLQEGIYAPKSGGVWVKSENYDDIGASLEERYTKVPYDPTLPLDKPYGRAAAEEEGPKDVFYGENYGGTSEAALEPLAHTQNIHAERAREQTGGGVPTNEHLEPGSDWMRTMDAAIIEQEERFGGRLTSVQSPDYETQDPSGVPFYHGMNIYPSGTLFRPQLKQSQLPSILSEPMNLIYSLRDSMENLYKQRESLLRQEFRELAEAGQSSEMGRTPADEERYIQANRYTAMLPQGGGMGPEGPILQLQDQMTTYMVESFEAMKNAAIEYGGSRRTDTERRAWKLATEHPQWSWPTTEGIPVDPHFLFFRAALVEIQAHLSRANPHVSSLGGPGSARSIPGMFQGLGWKHHPQYVGPGGGQ